MNQADEIITGNYYNKYESKNPVARWLTDGFKRNLADLVRLAAPTDIHEIGCGEGYLSVFVNEIAAPERYRASDYTQSIIDEAIDLHGDSGIDFHVRSVYELVPDDGADLMLCCEVLEHLEEPERALQRIRDVAGRYAVFSVPREPLWRACNMARLKYLGDLGNTPGHIQHWSRAEFFDLIGRYFEIVERRAPFPWSMALCRRK